MARRLTRRDFAMSGGPLARMLIGQRLVCVSRSGRRVSGVITETEAYIGPEDLASHAAEGRRTARNEAMYGPPGTAYVYFTYGMHHCFNVVGGSTGEPVAALVRAIRPEEGLDLMRRRRGRRRDGGPIPDGDLCAGPGRLCQALGVDLRLNGVDLTIHPRLFIEECRPRTVRVALLNTARIGVGNAGPWAEAPLRWVMRGGA